MNTPKARGLGVLPLMVCLCSLIAAPAVQATRDCPECPEMVAIPAGRFVMGAAPGEEERENLGAEFRGRSGPQRSVQVKGFSAGKFEVTRGEYRAFAQATRRTADGGCFVWTGATFEQEDARSWRDPGYAQSDAHPVTCVSWEDAGAYVAWLSRRTGKRYRLLTEAEWEYAARAGTTTARYWADDARGSCDYANGGDLSVRKVPMARDWDVADCDDRHPYTSPVGSYRANAWGLHDMLGNVEEWTQDCWNGNYGTMPTDGSAATAGDCSMRAVRGGSWIDAPLGVRAAYRVGSPTVVRVYRRGFRVATD